MSENMVQAGEMPNREESMESGLKRKDVQKVKRDYGQWVPQEVRGEGQS